MTRLPPVSVTAVRLLTAAERAASEGDAATTATLLVGAIKAFEAAGHHSGAKTARELLARLQVPE